MKKAVVWDETVIEVARYFVDNKSTVRKVEKAINMSKSTVHYKLQQLLNSPNVYYKEKKLAQKVEKLIEKNKQERYMRGGNATKQKYKKLKANR